MHPRSVRISSHRHCGVRPQRDPAAEGGPPNTRNPRPGEQSPTCCRQSQRQEENLAGAGQSQKSARDTLTPECLLHAECRNAALASVALLGLFLKPQQLRGSSSHC